MDLSMLCESFYMIYIIVKKYLKCIIRINLKAIKSLKKSWTNMAEFKIYLTIIINII